MTSAGSVLAQWSGWMGQAALTAKSKLVLAMGHQQQTLAAAGLDKLWPAQQREIPTAARAAQGLEDG